MRILAFSDLHRDLDQAEKLVAQSAEADVVINARVAIDPEHLERLVQQAVREACQAAGAAPEFRQTQSFRPGRPVPTHRFEQALVTLS